VNVTEAPAFAVWLTGCVVIVGATLTVSTAPLLVTEPTVLLTTTVYVPAFADPTPDIEYVALVAPAMLAPFFCHW
jgi:hypothetical protein